MPVDFSNFSKSFNDPGPQATPITFAQPVGATQHALVVSQPSWDGNPADSPANFVCFTLTGNPNVAPFYHFNAFGFGIVGDGTNNPPYFAIEDSTAINYKFQMYMNAAAAVPWSCWMSVNSQTTPTAVLPNMTIGAGGNLYLQAGLRFTDGFGQPGGTNQSILAQAARGLSIQNAAGTTNILSADPLVGTTVFGPFIKSKIRAVVDANANPISVSDYQLSWTSLTAARTSVIPAGFTVAQELVFKDQSGSCSGTNTITISVASAGTIDGAATFVLNTAFQKVTLYQYSAGVWFTR